MQRTCQFRCGLTCPLESSGSIAELPDLAVNLKNDIVRESIGESTIETRNLVDGEPDSDLFRVPGGYSMTKGK